MLIRPLIGSICALLLIGCDRSTSANSSADASKLLSTDVAMIAVGISIEQRDESILLSASLKNNSAGAFVFLPWGTPFEGAVTADFLSIRELPGLKEVPYTGIMVKRVPPSPEDFRSVELGESLESVVDISKSYDFCANTKYQIAYSQSLMSPEAEARPVQSDVVTMLTLDHFKEC